MGCVVCDSPTGMFAHKCLDGPVCNDCYSKTPSFFRVKDFDGGVVRFVCRNYDNDNERMCKIFSETCKVGSFHFDSKNLLGVIGQINKDGTIDDGNSDIFSMANVKEVSFVMINPKAVNEKKVTCDIQIAITFNDTFWTINEIVSKGEVCVIKDEGENISYDLPISVSIAWDEIIKAVNTKRGYIENAINNELVTEDDLAFYKARVLFMVEQDYTIEEIEEVHCKLKNAFCGDEKRLGIVDNAKNLLIGHLSLRNEF